MAQEVISDFLIKLGFDAKNVETGLKKINKMLDGFEKKLSRSNKSGGGLMGPPRALYEKPPHENYLLEKKNREKSGGGLMGPPRALYEKRLHENYLLEKKNREKSAADAERQAKKHYATLRKLKEADARKLEKAESIRAAAILRQERLVQASRIKQAVSNITAPSGNKITAKNSMFSPIAAKPIAAQPMQDAHVKRMQQQLALQERLNGKTEAYLQTIRVRKSIEAGLTNPERIRQELSMAKNAADYQKIRTRLTTNMSVQQSALNKKLKEQNYLMQRVNQSSKQLVGNYISVFAAVGVLSNVTTIGQDFESINATFKAVSENAQVAGENLQFVRDETMRLGLSYKEASKGFSQMLASNQGQLQLNEVKELFIGVSEAGTLLGLSADDQAGSLRALQQMLS